MSFVAELPQNRLTESQIQILRETWKLVQKDLPRVSGLFFGHIFKIAPAASEMFSFTSAGVPFEENKAGRTHAAVVLHVVGDSLTRLCEVEANTGHAGPVGQRLAEMGKRHAGYGVATAHYGVVKQALMNTLQEVFGDKFTPEVQVTWSKAYELVAETMALDDSGLDEEQAIRP